MAPAEDSAVSGLQRGILDCPTQAAPAYVSGETSITTSSAYKLMCASCHGALGEGKQQYPALPAELSADEFVRVVREGRVDKGMPAFAAEVVSDADLRADFAELGSARAKNLTELGLASDESTWSEERVEQAYREGLRAWRKPDAHGDACASCHSPDAIDLAVIAYDDAAIFRRALPHISPEDTGKVRDLVHAQRRRFGITRPCSTDWRPFQPGGEPLPGDTPAEQDRAFAEQLKQLGILLLTDRIDSLEKARQAFEQLTALDGKKLRIGIELPRWTNDVFNGPDHANFNDWMPGVNVTPDPAAYEAASDTYLAEPSLANYFELERAAVGYLGDRPAGLYREWFKNATEAKRRFVLLGSHFFRMELLKRGGWNELGQVPFPELASDYNPFAVLAGMTQEFSCSPEGGSFGGGQCEDLMSTFAPSQVAKFGGPTAEQMNSRFKDITHSWWTMATIFNQPILGSEDGIDGSFFYWTFRFPQLDIHHPFMFARLPALREQFFTKLQGTPAFPQRYSYRPKTHPLLSNRFFANQKGPLDLDSMPDLEGPNVLDGLRLRVNIIRMFAYLHIELLEGGAAIEGDTEYSPTGKDHFVKYYEALYPQLASHVAFFPGRMAELLADSEFAAKYPELVQDAAFYTTELETVLARARELVAQAPLVYPD
jgi:cytochrome c553